MPGCLVPEPVQHLHFPVLASFQVVSLATFFFFCKWDCFKDKVLLCKRSTLCTKVVIHGSCLCDLLLSHAFALLSVIHAELCDHAESKYASWHSTSNCMGEVFLRTWLRWACFLFYMVLCFMHKWLSPALWFFAYNSISCAVLWLDNIRQEMQTGACGKYSFYVQFVLPKWQGMGYRYIQGQQGDTTLLERSSDNF